MQDMRLYREMFAIKKVQKYKKNIASELYAWADTLDCEVDDEGEPSTNTYDFVSGLAERLENGECSERDYKKILFHIWQINYDEIKIRL